MTIGPEPMTRIRLRSVRFGINRYREIGKSGNRGIGGNLESGKSGSREIWLAWPTDHASKACAVARAKQDYPITRFPVYQIPRFPDSPISKLLDSLLHLFDELLEQVVRVVRPGRRFGMVLHAEDGLLRVAEPLHRAVIQVHVRHLHVRGQRLGVDREPVVLRRDLDLPGFQFLDRMVRAAMA